MGQDVLTEDGLFMVNIGPQHPSTHGVLHLKVWLDGETIVKFNHISVTSIAPLRK